MRSKADETFVIITTGFVSLHLSLFVTQEGEYEEINRLYCCHMGYPRRRMLVHSHPIVLNNR